MHSRRSSNNGWLLVGLIVILSSVMVAMAGIALALAESRRTISIRENDTEAVYFAQAGVMQALYDFRRGQEITLREYNVENPSGPLPGPNDDTFILGGQMADFLLVNMKGVITFPTANFCNGSRDRIQGWTIRNVLANGQMSLVIDKIKVNWSPPGGEGVLRIDLNGIGADWTAPGCVPVPADTDIDIPDQTITANAATWTTNRIWFTSDQMQQKGWIDITFTMAPPDGSVRVSHWDRLIPANSSADFTVKSVGEVRKGAFPFVMWRRLAAEYRLGSSSSLTAGTILRYQELTAKTP